MVKEKGEKIELHYNLVSERMSELYFVKLYVSHAKKDNSFVEISFLSGDVGAGVKPGKSKVVVWDVYREFQNISASQLTFQIKLFSMPVALKDFSWVKGGSFVMGSDEGDEDAKPAHQVSVSDFYIGKYEVTVAEYKLFCEQTNRPFPNEKIEWLADHPMTFVSWYDAESYCLWLQKITNLPFRLPTEAEWEYAAKEGQLSREYTFSGSNNINDVGWYKQNSIGTMHSTVGKLKPNSLGIFDMSGNVWEWCADWYNSKYYSFSPSENPGGPSVGKVKAGRGGSWFNRDVNLTFRYFVTPTSKTNYLGFRVACTPPAGTSLINAATADLAISELTPPFVATRTANAPTLEIIDPKLTSSEVLHHFGPEFKIKGRIKSDSKILMVLVGGVETPFDEQGYFERSVKLGFTENKIVIRTYDIENRMASDTVNIYRILNKDDIGPSVNRHGIDYALLVGTSEYEEFEPLANPILDIEAVGNELEKHYGFVAEKIKNPTLETLYTTLRNYGKRKYSSDDQLFIFIAGHGVFDNLFGDGYLVLADSKKDDHNKTGHISHSYLRTILNNIDCNHIFLVLDVCFGGVSSPFLGQRQIRKFICYYCNNRLWICGKLFRSFP